MSLTKDVLFSNKKYIVRFAQNEGDMIAAQRLRYNVFNIELGEGLQRSHDKKLDADIYDKQCDHLLVISKESGEVVGTYRMQTYQKAKKEEGFYTADEFEISEIPSEILNESIEVGRACIDPAHRNGRVLYLLWRGLAKYLVEHNKQFMFGCCSLTSQSPEEAWMVMQYLDEKGYMHDSLKVFTTDKYFCEQVAVSTEKLETVRLPQLFRLYMDLGAKVCSLPAMDKEFKTIDYLVLLDIGQLDEHTRILFFS